MNMLWPIYEFRPLTKAIGMQGQIYRYAEGKWIEDDGEYDLAFASLLGTYCLYVELPYRKNILWAWTTQHWSGFEPEHPRGNAWHYMLREGTSDWDGDWGRDRHHNAVAGRTGMDWICKSRSCASGRHVEFHLNDPHILEGLLREKETKTIVKVPEFPICMYCGTKWRKIPEEVKEVLF